MRSKAAPVTGVQGAHCALHPHRWCGIPSGRPIDGDATASPAHRRYRWIPFRCSSQTELNDDDDHDHELRFVLHGDPTQTPRGLNELDHSGPPRIIS